MIAGIVYAIFAFINFLIGMRFILELVGANPSSNFVNWIYDWSTPLVAPFATVLGQSATITGQGVVTQSVFDWAALVALAVYVVVGAILGRVLSRTGH